jgi:hypothetical protein
MQKDKRTTRPLHRLAAAATCGVVLALLTTPWAGGATDDFVAGSGNSYAQVLRIGPTAGELSLAPILGVTLADYTDTVARGVSESADLAAIGVASPCLDASIPRVRVSSNDKGAEKGKESTFAGQKDQSGNGGGAGELFASATKAPTASSRFRTATFQIPGIIGMSGGESTTTTGLVTENGTKLRRSAATVTINEFDFGPVVLKGLRWNAVQETDAQQHRKQTGTFTISSASAGGLPLPVTNGDLRSVLGPINTALAPTGFAIAPPTFDKTGGISDVSPLSIQIINSPLGRQFLGPVLGAAQPIREPLTDQLIPLLKQPAAIVGGNPNDCSQHTFPDLSVAVLVADLSVGIAAGSSEMHLDLGGANAYTEGQKFANPFNFTLTNLSAPSAPKTLFTAGTAGTAAIPGTVGAEVPTADTTQLAAAAPPHDKTIPGRKGGVAIVVGLAGLAAGGGLAAADWFRMRASRRAAP